MKGGLGSGPDLRSSPETILSRKHGFQDGPLKSTSCVVTVPAVRPGAVW
jgi:hypothetical protein